MTSVKRDFNIRVQEINLYFRFLEQVLIQDCEFIFKDGVKEKPTPSITNIFKANSFLILYNLCESCIKSAIEEIYQTLAREHISYDDLRPEIKTEIIKSLKSNIKADSFVNSVNSIAYDIILEGFNLNNLLSGNLDALKIRKLAECYGFDSNTNTKVTKNGANLLTVKNKRNNLAHGVDSFHDCGRDYTIQDLISIKNEVLNYLEEIILNIEVFLSTKKYLATP